MQTDIDAPKQIVSVWKFIFALLLVMLVWIAFAPGKAAAADYPDASCLSNAGNVNIVVFVKVLKSDGSFSHWADNFKFDVSSYARPGASASEKAVYNNLKYQSILFRKNGTADGKGNGTHTLEVKMNNNGNMAAGKGNACKPNADTARKAAYAFRDGDGTSLSCWPRYPNGAIQRGCNNNNNIREDNNDSWLLSCLASNATAYKFRAADIMGEGPGSWQAGSAESDAIINWTNDRTVELESRPNDELNTKERKIVFTWKLDPVPGAKIVPRAGPNGAVQINQPFTFENWAETSQTVKTGSDTFKLKIDDSKGNLPAAADWGPHDRQINPDRDVPDNRSSYTFTPTATGKYCRQTTISSYPNYVKDPDGKTAEQCVDVTAPTDREVKLTPTVTPVGSEIEAGDPAEFGGYVKVSGYPQIVEWGYTEQAVAQASVRYSPTFTAAVESTYEYSNASSSAQYCSNGGLVSNNCYIASYQVCSWSYGTPASAKCAKNFVLTTIPASSGYIYTWYSCPAAYPNGGGYSSQCYRPVYRCTETGGAYSPNYPTGCRERIQCEDNAYPTGWYRTIPNGRQCDIWRCQYPDTPKYKQSSQPLCAYRCSNGYASQAAKTWDIPGQAPLATAGSSNSGYSRYDAGDLNCYREARFNFTCEWRTSSNVLLEPAQTVSVNYTNSTQNLCNNPVSVPTTLIGEEICVTYRAIAPGAPYFSAPQPGKKQGQTWRVTGGNGSDCMDVVGKPYVRVVGGDAASGIGAGGTSASCSSNVSATIVAHNKGSSQGYKGSGASVAAIARGSITGFGSAQFATASLGVVPKSISFANDTGTWGGNWGSSVACLATDGLVTTGSALPPSPITTEHRVRMSGNVFIGNNITYQTGKWNGVDKLPLFQLVVNGNIYIGNNVTQLDGLYVAQGGSIYTCANTSGPILNAWSNNPAEQCNRQLIVNGSLVGDQIYLTRDCATSNRASVGETTIFTASGIDVQNCNTTSTTKASEVINFLPEQWIRGSIGRPDTRYDAVTNMPPVL